jgi:hypothetical protein
MNRNIPSSLLNNEALKKLDRLRPNLKVSLPFSAAKAEKITDVSFQHGERAPSLNAHFHYQRKLSDAPGPELQQTWFCQMKNVLEELDQVLRCIPQTCPFRFLDVG